MVVSCNRNAPNNRQCKHEYFSSKQNQKHKPMKKKILYIDMDNVIVDFQSGVDRLPPDIISKYDGRLDEVPSIFSLMEPMAGAIESYQILSENFDTYILSTSPWENLSAASDKFAWVRLHLGEVAYKRLILTHHKQLNLGDFLIDDRPNNGADKFRGELIRFGDDKFPNWKIVTSYLLAKLQNQEMEPQTLYQSAIKFAAAKHLGQIIPGSNLTYVVHLSNVAMEIIMASFHSVNFNLGFAVQVALLHDTIEDTSTTFGELEYKFGVEIAKAVSALTKNKDLPKEQQIEDSLERIKKLQVEVWAVKLADRITNLQPPPPNWSMEKIIKYQQDARTIVFELKDGNFIDFCFNCAYAFNCFFTVINFFRCFFPVGPAQQGKINISIFFPGVKVKPFH